MIIDLLPKFSFLAWLEVCQELHFSRVHSWGGHWWFLIGYLEDGVVLETIDHHYMSFFDFFYKFIKFPFGVKHLNTDTHTYIHKYRHTYRYTGRNTDRITDIRGPWTVDLKTQLKSIFSKNKIGSQRKWKKYQYFSVLFLDQWICIYIKFCWSVR